MAQNKPPAEGDSQNPTPQDEQPILPHEMHSEEIEQAIGDAEITRNEILHQGLDQLESAEATLATARRILSFNGFDHISSRCGEMERMFEDLYRLINQEMDSVEAIVINLNAVAADHALEPYKFIKFWLAAYPTNHDIVDMKEWAKRLKNTSQLAQTNDATKRALRDAGYRIELVI